jgi:hypothetical protein
MKAPAEFTIRLPLCLHIVLSLSPYMPLYLPKSLPLSLPFFYICHCLCLCLRLCLCLCLCLYLRLCYCHCRVYGFIEPKHTIISKNKCYCNNKFSCFPLYNMSGCRLLISKQIYMKIHYMITGYIYESVEIKTIDYTE